MFFEKINKAPLVNKRVSLLKIRINKTEKSFSPIGCAVSNKSVWPTSTVWQPLYDDHYVTTTLLWPLCQDHCVTTTEKRLLCHDHCVKTTVSGPLCDHWVKTTVWQPLCDDHCVTTTVLQPLWELRRPLCDYTIVWQNYFALNYRNMTFVRKRQTRQDKPTTTQPNDKPEFSKEKVPSNTNYI